MTDRVAWLRFEAKLLRDDIGEWLLLTGDRRLVSALTLAVLTAVLGLVVHSGHVPLRASTPVLFLLFALIAGNFTLIAIVTSLSQFLLGRRLESPGEIRGEIQETLAYRQDVSDTSGQAVVPVTPHDFFVQLYRIAEDDLTSLGKATGDTRTKRTEEEVAALVDGLSDHIDFVLGLLDQPSSEMKHALFVTLSTDYENYVHRTWRLRTEYGDELTADLAEPLDRLTETLQHIVVATRLFKTTFIETEIAELSRYLLYVGLPAQVAAMLVTLLYTAPEQTPTVSTATLRVLVPAVLTAGFAPFLLLAAYVVRLAVVAHRTAESFPFSSHLEGAFGERPEGQDAE